MRLRGSMEIRSLKKRIKTKIKDPFLWKALMEWPNLIPPKAFVKANQPEWK